MKGDSLIFQKEKMKQTLEKQTTGLASIYYVGDLDGDHKPDLLVDLYECDVYAPNFNLYLSSLAGKNQLLGHAAQFGDICPH
jgi:hypothetical protein